MGIILEWLNLKKNKADKTDMLYRQGIRFESAKDKHLRLYYESQFNTDIEEDDLNFLQHIFEQKTYSLFGSHYSIINYINTDSFLKDTYEKLIDTNYKEFKDIIISYIPKFNKHLTPYQYKQIYNKMKDKVQLYIDPTNVDDINLWPIPILKEFKAEIEILAISNIINQKIGIYINEEENVNSEREIKSKIKKEKISDNSIDSDISENSL